MKNFFVRLGLQFSNDTDEAAFAEKYVRSSIRAMQLYMVLGGVFFYSFFVLDRMIDPVNWETTYKIRTYVMMPVGISLSLLLFTPLGRRMFEAIVIFGVAICLVGLAVIYAILERGYEYSALGVTLVVLGSAIMFPVRVRYLTIQLPVAILIMATAHFIAANARDGWLTVNIIACVTSVSFAILAGYARESSARKQYIAEQNLTESRARVEQLLHSMLPREIAARIQAGETSIADSHGEVAIVFADLNGFTELARQISPPLLVDMLNGLFSAFDLEAERFGIERIKTIGDAYMAIAGLEPGTSVTNHTQRAAEFAIAIQETVQQMVITTGYPINVRIGIHVGPVVAGVIGVKRPAFDCWGESVNYASRLEGRADPGTILISETAHWRLGQEFETNAYGDVELKGFGTSRVYRLLQKRTTAKNGVA
jgi:adenylate cyclase